MGLHVKRVWTIVQTLFIFNGFLSIIADLKGLSQPLRN